MFVRKKVFTGLVIGASFFFYGCSDTPSAHPQKEDKNSTTVDIKDDTAFGFFTPSSITVEKNSTITWKNLSSHPHDVTFEEHYGTSGLFYPSQEYNLKATIPGTFNYVCKIHPGMAGEIIVLDSQA